MIHCYLGIENIEMTPDATVANLSIVTNKNYEFYYEYNHIKIEELSKEVRGIAKDILEKNLFELEQTENFVKTIKTDKESKITYYLTRGNNFEFKREINSFLEMLHEKFPDEQILFIVNNCVDWGLFTKRAFLNTEDVSFLYVPSYIRALPLEVNSFLFALTGGIFDVFEDYKRKMYETTLSKGVPVNSMFDAKITYNFLDEILEKNITKKGKDFVKTMESLKKLKNDSKS